MNPFFEVTPKKGFFIRENLLAKVTQNFRQIWGTLGNKYVCGRGQKWQNFIFTTRNKKNNFFCKKYDGKCQI